MDALCPCMHAGAQSLHASTHNVGKHIGAQESADGPARFLGLAAAALDLLFFRLLGALKLLGGGLRDVDRLAAAAAAARLRRRRRRLRGIDRARVRKLTWIRSEGGYQTWRHRPRPGRDWPPPPPLPDCGDDDDDCAAGER